MVKIFADSANLSEMEEMNSNPLVVGFTTNPTLMRKAGVKDYETWGRALCERFPEHPISFEVIADDFSEMYRQAKKLATWGERVYVKIPVVNTGGEFAGDIIRSLADEKVKLNVTAVMSYEHIHKVMDCFSYKTPAIMSVFAGRIADTGRQPQRLVRKAVGARKHKWHEILWASPRQVLDVYLAEECGCDIITVTKEILSKLKLEGKGLKEFSRETSEMFYNDAKAAGYTL